MMFWIERNPCCDEYNYDSSHPGLKSIGLFVNGFCILGLISHLQTKTFGVVVLNIGFGVWDGK